MQWITHDELDFERIACCWLIARFIDRDAELIFARRGTSLSGIAQAIPFAVERRLRSRGPGKFEGLLADYGLVGNRALAAVAASVRAAAVPRSTPPPETFDALIRGLEALFPSSRRLLRHAFVVCDALYEGECARLGLAGWSSEETQLPRTHHWSPGSAASFGVMDAPAPA